MSAYIFIAIFFFFGTTNIYISTTKAFYIQQTRLCVIFLIRFLVIDYAHNLTKGLSYRTVPLFSSDNLNVCFITIPRVLFP